jgi:hypothetical protein
MSPSLHRHQHVLAAISSVSSRLNQVNVQAGLLSLAAAVLMLFSAPDAIAAKLGGAYFVDDAEIGRLGSCEIESWGSFADNTDRVLVFSPACVFNLGRPVELGANFVKMRSDGAWNSTLALTAKTVPLPINGDGLGLAVAGAVTYDLTNHIVNGLIVNVPVTWDISKRLRFNVNVGAQYDVDQRELLATMGTGISWNFVPQWSWISEVFAVLGPDQTNPRYQTGIRYNPTKDIDLDLIYGRNLTGEGANWITLALAVRIGDE